MEYTDSARNRLKRIEGQVRGVLTMMSEARNCADVITQLSAIRSAVDKTIATIVAENLEFCVRNEMEHGKDSNYSIKEAIDLLIRSK